MMVWAGEAISSSAVRLIRICLLWLAAAEAASCVADLMATALLPSASQR